MSDDNGGESLPIKVEEPVFNGYQLIGDSQFLRFSGSLLNLKRKEKDGFSYLGLCVSGQRIRHLLSRIKSGFGDVSERVVLMIGTNDLLGGTNFEEMQDGLAELLKSISQNAKKIILLTLPPVLKLEKSKDHWDRLKQFNEFIKTLHDDEKCFVGDAYAEFVFPKKLLNTASNLTNIETTLEPMPICDAKDDFIACSVKKDEVSHQAMPSLSPRDDDSKVFPPQLDTPEKIVHRRRSSSNSASNDKNCCSSVASSATSDSAPITSTADPMTFTPDSALTQSVDAVIIPAVGTTTPSGSAEMPGDATVSSEGETIPFKGQMSPGGATTPCDGRTALADGELTDCPKTPTDRGIPLDSSMTTSDGGMLSLIDGLSPISSSSGELSPSSGEISPSGGKMTLSGDAMSPTCVTPTLSASEDSFKTRSRKRRPSLSASEDSFKTPSRKRRAFRKKPNSHSSGDSCQSEKKLARKRKRYSCPSGRNYPFKKKFDFKRRRNSYPSGSSYRNDSGEPWSIHEVVIDNADEIRDEYFEKYYDSDCRRPDRIHLNAVGLRVIKRIIEHIIDTIDKEKSAV